MHRPAFPLAGTARLTEVFCTQQARGYALCQLIVEASIDCHQIVIGTKSGHHRGGYDFLSAWTVINNLQLPARDQATQLLVGAVNQHRAFVDIKQHVFVRNRHVSVLRSSVFWSGVSC